PSLAFIGRMTDQKGPDRAIDAARQASFPIRLAGNIDVGNPTYFDDQVKPRLCDDAIHIGEIDDAGKQKLLRRAQALVFPIDWPEPFGLVMIEAMACGTPVVALRRGAVGEVVDDGVTGFVVDHVTQLPDAIRAATKLDRRVVRRAFEARFSADMMARGYADIYARIINGDIASNGRSSAPSSA
ncbi:MAG: glycosyltransferase, partial [Pseudomonadota bacterium]